MRLKRLSTIIFFLLIFIVKAQDDFITVWKPSLPPPFYPYAGIPVNSTNNQIWFPGRGTNYQIHWEEIGYPSHSATLANVNSTYQLLIDFGTPLNPNPSNATYRVKISSGNGIFHQIRFTDSDMFNDNGVVGDVHKIQLVEQWGNSKWSSMQEAFKACKILDITATDIPDLSKVSDMSNMFDGCYSFIGNPSINNWNISTVTNLLGTFSGCFVFNQPVGNWNTSNVIFMDLTFNVAKMFNQPLENWDTSKVITTAGMFTGAFKFNQPIGDWNTSQITEMNYMFSNAKAFNQDISNWDIHNVKYMYGMFSNAINFNNDISNWNVSSVELMNDMFNGATKFNQNIGNWNVITVKSMNNMFSNATSFNQNLGSWNLSSLTSAINIFKNSALNCQSYDSTLYGWSQNPSTPDNITISSVSPLTYSNPAAVTARNYLLNNKAWSITGDTYNGECQSFLGTSDIKTKKEISLYPNPAADFIYIKNSNTKDYVIFDLSGKIVSKGILTDEKINIQTLTSGNYILQIHSKEHIQNLNFIKK